MGRLILIVTALVLSQGSFSNGQYFPYMFQAQNPGTQSFPGGFPATNNYDNRNTGGNNVGGWPFFTGLFNPQQQQGFTNNGYAPNNFQQSNPASQKQNDPAGQQNNPYLGSNPFFSGYPGFVNPWFNPQQQQYNQQQPTPTQGQSPSVPYQQGVSQQDYRNPNPTQNNQDGYNQLNKQNIPQTSPVQEGNSAPQQSFQGSPSQQGQQPPQSIPVNHAQLPSNQGQQEQQNPNTSEQSKYNQEAPGQNPLNGDNNNGPLVGDIRSEQQNPGPNQGVPANETRNQKWAYPDDK